MEDETNDKYEFEIKSKEIKEELEGEEIGKELEHDEREENQNMKRNNCCVACSTDNVIVIVFRV